MSSICWTACTYKANSVSLPTNRPYSIRPCNHAFCSPCTGDRRSKSCPKCKTKVDRIVSVAAPMAAPGTEETALQLPVVLLASGEGRFLRGRRVRGKRSMITTALRKVILIFLPRRRTASPPLGSPLPVRWG